MRTDIANFLNFYLKEDLMLLNKSEIARRFNCDPRTVERHLKIQRGDLKPTVERQKRPSILDDYKSTIIEKVDMHGASAMAVYRFITKKGYTGKYATVSRFVKEHKDTQTRKATIRFETSPGLQAQADWKEEVSLATKCGAVLKVNLFLIVLGYSRAKYICPTCDRTQETLFRCLMNAFDCFGGVPKEILFDNMKTVVDRAKSTFAKVELNQTFKHFATDAGFKAITCRPYRPQTKGKVESLAKLTDRLVVYNNEIEDYDDFVKTVRSFCDEINGETSQATGLAPNDLLAKEKEYLLPMPDMQCLYSYLRPEKTCKVHKDAMIVYDGGRYSVPPKFIGKTLSALEYDDGNLCLYYNGDFVACHPLSDKKFNYTHEHAAEILRSDACKGMTCSEIDDFIRDNLSGMDIYLEG